LNFTLFKRNVPLSKQVPKKGRIRLIHNRSQKIHSDDLSDSNNSNRNSKSNRINRLYKPRDSLEPPKIGLRMPTPEKMHKNESLESDFHELGLELLFNNQVCDSEEVRRHKKNFCIGGGNSQDL